jgi:ABC-type uncharacterized transport system permease subunit
MNEVLSTVTFGLALLLYGGASVLFYLDVARERGAGKPPASTRTPVPAAPPGKRPLLERPDLAPRLLGLAALGHAAYVTLASFVAHVCPIRSVHFLLSVASLFAIAAYLTARIRFRIGALGLLISPLGLAFLLGTYFLGRPASEHPLSAVFITLHVMSNLVGIALFFLAGAAAGLYLVQERRLKKKKRPGALTNLPPLDTLETAVHRFLVAGFPLLTLGIVTGTYWVHDSSPDSVMRTIFGYAMWLLIAGVLVLRALWGWRGRRTAYGTIAGLFCAAAVLVIYLVRPAGEGDAPGKRGLAPEAPALETSARG